MTSVAASSGTAVRIRPLRSADLEAVLSIDAAHTGARKRTWWKDRFREVVGGRPRPGRVALAAVEEGRLVGYLLGEVRAFEFGSEPCGWIVAVGVSPASLRTGVATAMLHEASRRFGAAGVHTVRTMVRRDAVPVLSFFRSRGFAGGPFVQLEASLEEGGS